MRPLPPAGKSCAYKDGGASLDAKRGQSGDDRISQDPVSRGWSAETEGESCDNKFGELNGDYQPSLYTRRSHWGQGVTYPVGTL